MDYAHARLIANVTYRYALTSMRWFADSPRRRAQVTGTVKADAKGGLTVPFAGEAPGEWLLEITSDNTQVRTLPVLGLYVIEPAQRKLRPYIGDLHSHSTGSDGRQEPAYCGIRARSFGFDFFALTDHNNFRSSGDMIRKVRGKLGRKMLLMQGEELHMAGCDFHYVGIGHSHGIEDLRAGDKAKYRAALRKILRELRSRPTVPTPRPGDLCAGDLEAPQGAGTRGPHRLCSPLLEPRELAVHRRGHTANRRFSTANSTPWRSRQRQTTRF